MKLVKLKLPSAQIRTLVFYRTSCSASLPLINPLLTVGSMMGWLTMPSYSSESSIRLGGLSCAGLPLTCLEEFSSPTPLAAASGSASSVAAAAVAVQSVRRSGSFTLQTLMACFPVLS